MTRFIEVSDSDGKHYLINLSAIASIEDHRKMVVLHFINPAQKSISIATAYESVKHSISNGDPIIRGGMIL